LKESARDEWDFVIPVENNLRTVDAFELCLTTWKKRYISEEAFVTQRDYILTVPKPFTMDVREFTFRIKSLCSLLQEFPLPEGATLVTDAEMKNIIFKAMPTLWKTNFTNANLHILHMELAELVEYMTKQKALSEQRSERTYDDNRSHGNRGGRGHGSRNGKDRRSKHIASRQNRASNNNHNNKDCRIHPGLHGWIDCFGNPNGPNYKPDFVPRGGGRNSDRGGRNGSHFAGRNGGRNNGNGRGRATGENHYQERNIVPYRWIRAPSAATPQWGATNNVPPTGSYMNEYSGGNSSIPPPPPSAQNQTGGTNHWMENFNYRE
jgi:hypothetical protein